MTEKLFANISNSVATGRTNNVTATMKMGGTTINDVTVTADLRDLKSDRGLRDGRIKSEGLESDRFPEAKFVLTSPVTLSAVPAVGETVKTQATGDFTLHGVTKSVTISLEGRWDGKQVQVVGNLPIVFGEGQRRADPDSDPVQPRNSVAGREHPVRADHGDGDHRKARVEGQPADPRPAAVQPPVR